MLLAVHPLGRNIGLRSVIEKLEYLPEITDKEQWLWNDFLLYFDESEDFNWMRWYSAIRHILCSSYFRVLLNTLIRATSNPVIVIKMHTKCWFQFCCILYWELLLICPPPLFCRFPRDSIKKLFLRPSILGESFFHWGNYFACINSLSFHNWGSLGKVTYPNSQRRTLNSYPKTSEYQTEAVINNEASYLQLFECHILIGCVWLHVWL